MSISGSWTRRAMAFVSLSLLCVGTACGGFDASETGGDDDVSPELYDVVSSGSTTTPMARRKRTSPTLTSITPAHGPAVGGTAITVAGSNFAAGATLTINGSPCTNVVAVSSTQVSAVTPAGNAGARDVVVTNPDGQRATLWSGFTYDAIVVTPPPPTGTSGSLRGTNLVGMEGGYGFNVANGPIPNTEYAVHSTEIVDYLLTKNVKVIRLLFSWERVQSTLGGPIPAATSGNYKA